MFEKSSTVFLLIAPTSMWFLRILEELRGNAAEFFSNTN